MIIRIRKQFTSRARPNNNRWRSPWTILRPPQITGARRKSRRNIVQKKKKKKNVFSFLLFY